MKTKEVYKKLDNVFTKTLKKYNLFYSLRKVKNLMMWKTQIGKFNSITDPYIEGEVISIDGVDDNLISNFQELLSIAIKEEV